MDLYKDLMTGVFDYENWMKNIQVGYETTRDIEVNETLPNKPPPRYQALFDCRLQLLLHENVTIDSGETKSVATTCIIAPNHGWNLSTLSNLNLNIIFREEYVKNNSERYRLYVTISNITHESKSLPNGLCIGYLLMK